MFGEIAPVYDGLNTLFSFKVDSLWRRYTAKSCIQQSDRMILDIACGSGELTRAIRKRAHKDAQVIGLDFCAPLLLKAKMKEPLPYFQGDALNLPFPDNTFDVLTIAFGLRNLENLDQGLQEMLRILKPGGRLGVLEFTKADSAILSACHNLYQDKILPKIGDFVSGTKAYSYLNESVQQWPDSPKLAQIMKRNGFKPVRYSLLHMRNAALHIGEKP